MAASVAALFASAACADVMRDANDCVSQDPARIAEGCTALIERMAEEVDLEKAYYNRGTMYARKKDFERAINDFNNAIALNPKYVTAINNRGASYLQKGDFEQAVADFSAAISIDPDNARYWSNRGDAYEKTGKPDLALSDYRKSLELKPNEAIAAKLQAIEEWARKKAP